jgi:hypothetical protein
LTPFFLLFCYVRLPQCLCLFHHGVGLLAYVTSLFTLLTPYSIYSTIHFSVQIYPPTLCPTNEPVDLFSLNPLLIRVCDDRSMYDWLSSQSCMMVLQCLLLSCAYYDNGLAWLPVPSCPATLLSVIPHLENRSYMNNYSYIRLVDA